MKSIFYSLFLLVFTFGLSAQNKSSLEVSGGLDYTYRFLSGDDAGEEDVVYAFHYIEEAVYTWSAGMFYNRRFASKWHFKTGVRLARISIRAVFDNLPENVQNDLSFYKDNTLTEVHHFVQFPLLMRYHLSKDKKWTPYVEAGVCPSFYTKTKRIVKASNRPDFVSSENIGGIDVFQLVGSIGVGVNYQATDRWQLFVQPTFRQHLTKLQDTPTREYLHSIGLEVGGRMSLR